jgi:cyclic beta-1,2-glucan synthetase
VTILTGGQTTPAPWTNIIANPSFGFQVTADGGGYSWWHNSRENQVSPWSNDPVADRPGEVFYVRDEESGAVWGPTASPTRVKGGRYQVHHGMGYSRFLSAANGIELDLLQFVPVEDPIKISRLTLRNTTQRTRRLSVTAYVEWVLGPSRAVTAPMIVTERDSSGAILAHNPWNTSFGSYVAFAAMPGREVHVTADRREFLGRNGTLVRPAALARQQRLSGRVGAGLDPCAGLQSGMELHPGQSLEVVFLLGATETAEHVRQLLAAYAEADLDAVLAAVARQWDDVVGVTQVKTPDRSMDIMLNGWLLYQTLACRIWARAGFYQASGAFGFRDQLQDGMALVAVRPDLTRAHLIRAAGRQFPEGDVQHWWLPPSGQGVRTRISDDRVWLAYACSRYLQVTADTPVLDEAIPFLSGPQLGEHEHEAYFTPSVSETTASLYEHCALGLDDALATGRHGLPLIGTGDWNDGMSRVGEGGKGESVWLAWFLYTTLQQFAPVAEARGDMSRAQKWRDHAATLQASIEREAWDGGWYRRGYFDDGTPLGSVASSECRIDAIAQSWAVISGAAEPVRATQAMAALDDQLIRRHDGLALLFTPPFDRTPLDPGYIKGYPPGLRENGGQYTHAGTWSVIALALRGEGDKAGELFAMLNPINHSLTSADAYRYKVEPYVIAADIYSASGHVGRGGWTWYTGSAGWFYRAGSESILGLQHQGETLQIDPCIPRAWKRFEALILRGDARYDIVVENPNGVSQGISEATLDGVTVAERPARFRLTDDGKPHSIRLVMG